MPLELRIDVIPRGVESLREILGTVRITQIEQHDQDPGGERTYSVVGARRSEVRHRRRDGALVLVAKALAADAGGEFVGPFTDAIRQPPKETE